MNIDEYEQLPTTSVITNMTAGAFAGILEHCVMYPLDSVKTRMQSLSHSTANGRGSVMSTLIDMMKTEGTFRPIRGMSAVVLGAGPAHAFYFATYEYTKEAMSNFSQMNQLNYVIAATSATLVHDAISNPTEVIKQRLQMYNSKYKTVIECTKAVYRLEGMKAFYRSYTTQLLMNLPYQTIHFTTYEFIQSFLNSDHKYNPPVHVIAGGAAGAAAAAFTTPLDVVKTLLNTQETGIGSTRGMFEAIRQIHTVAGPLGFFKGLVPRVLYSMPATAICWSTYEFFKYMLSRTLKVKDAAMPSLTTQLPSAIISNNLPIDKTRIDDSPTPKIALRYVLPATSVSAAADSPSTGSLTTEIPSSLRDTTPIKSRELPAMSGAGMYAALNLNTMHSDTNVHFDRRRSV